MNTEEESAVPMETTDSVKEVTASAGSASENFVVLDTAGDSEESDKDDKVGKDLKDKIVKNNGSDSGGKATSGDSVAKPGTSNQRLRKKPKAPVVDVNSLRKRKWQLKVYPLNADDLQLNYMSILCKLASESLLYIPSEGRHGKAELYVATQKETAAIIGKLLRMGFHHNLLSIEVARKDTGGKEDGDESKKECKAFLMFDKFLSKKIFDAKGEKGTLIEKTVTLNKLPKAATKDFIGALFPFATDIEIIESDNPDERKATVKCKTPVTSLLVYKSFKRLEINDVHVKLTIDESVKAITLPPMFFIPPPEKKDMGPPDSIESLNQSSLPRRPMMTSLNRRVQLIKKRALITRSRIMRGPLLRNQRPNQGLEEQFGEGPRGPLPHRPFPRRIGDGNRYGPPMRNHGPGSRDYPGGPGHRRMIEKQNDRRDREHNSRDRNVTREMLQLQNQLNQAIKNQIAMLNTTQPTGSHLRHDNFVPPVASHRTSILGQGPRHFNAEIGDPLAGRVVDHHNNPDFGGSSWSADHSSRMPRGNRNERDRPDGDRQERVGRAGVDRTNRPDRTKQLNLNARPDRLEGNGRDRGDRHSSAGEGARQPQRGPRQPQAFGGTTSGDAVRPKGGRSSLNTSHGSERGSTRGGRGPEYPGSGRSSQQRNDGAYTSGSRGQTSGSNRYNQYNSQVQGDNNAYFRRF